MGIFMNFVGSEDHAAAHILFLENLEVGRKESGGGGVGEDVHEPGVSPDRFQLSGVGERLVDGGDVQGSVVVVPGVKNIPERAVGRDVEEIFIYAVFPAKADDVGGVSRHHGQQTLLNIRSLRHHHRRLL